MRKIDIRARIEQLDALLHRRKQTLSQQMDERQRLVQACQVAGDHVPTVVFTSVGGVVDQCEFCGLRLNATADEIARHLVMG